MRASNFSFLIVILSLTILTIFLLLTFQNQTQEIDRSLRTNKKLSIIRAFPVRQSSSDNQDWCIPSANKSKKSTTSGLLYVKTPKTGSSTLAGVTLRIAHRNGLPGKPCLNQHIHNEGRTFKNRSLDKSFLFGSVREPRSRILSHVFFEFVSRGGMEPTDENIIEKLKVQLGPKNTNLFWAGFQNIYLSMRNKMDLVVSSENFSRGWLKEIVTEIIHNYDFLIITERMDESLVALHFLLGVKLSDIIYLSSKVNGGYDDGLRGECTKIEKPFASPKVTEYMDSEDFKMRIRGDTMLFKVANKCLDATIEKIGRDKFDVKLKEYRELLELAHEKCASKAIFPCSADGVYHQVTNCYWTDGGCGYPCLDELVDTMETVVSVA